MMQVVFDEPVIGSEGFSKAGTLRSEYVVAIVGKVQKRSAAVNENLKTGDIEVFATQLRVLSEAAEHRHSRSKPVSRPRKNYV